MPSCAVCCIRIYVRSLGSQDSVLWCDTSCDTQQLSWLSSEMSGGNLHLLLRFRFGLNADLKLRSNKGHTENHIAVIYFIHPCENWCNSHLSMGITGKFQEILNSGRVILKEGKVSNFKAIHSVLLESTQSQEEKSSYHQMHSEPSPWQL